MELPYITQNSSFFNGTWFIALFGLILAIAPTYIIYRMAYDIHWRSYGGLIIVVSLSVLSIFLIWYGIKQSTCVEAITIDQRLVTVERTSWVSSKTWKEPISNYSSVKFILSQTNFSDNTLQNRRITKYMVTLEHQNESKRVVLKMHRENSRINNTLVVQEFKIFRNQFSDVIKLPIAEEIEE